MAPRVLPVAVIAAAIAATVAGCGDTGSPRFAGSPVSAVEAYGSCVFCHEGTGNRLFENGGHGGFDLRCESCHDDLRPNDPGPGHRAVPACVDCHTEQVTHHDMPAEGRSQCVLCHTPHGSPNLLLVRTSIETPSGARAMVEFSDLGGLRDGGHASVTSPGTGVCETCHTETRYYRSDGTGEPHFEFPCYTCHTHATGFAP